VLPGGVSVRTIEIIHGLPTTCPDWWDIREEDEDGQLSIIATVYTTEADAQIVKRALEGGDHAEP
jgi:hypothetical protein